MRGKLFTYEMFLGLISSIPKSLNKIGLIILDEAQFITDSSRGINVELLLTNLLMARQNGVNPQIIALSAVIGEISFGTSAFFRFLLSFVHHIILFHERSLFLICSTANAQPQNP